MKTLRESYPPRLKQGFVIFLTGLHNSGKDTIAKALQVTLNQQGGRSVSLLLGDSIGSGTGDGMCPMSAQFEPVLTFPSIVISKTPGERSKDLQRIAFVSAELARAGAAVIAAPVASQTASRDAMKNTVLSTAGPGGNFFTIHVATPFEHCESTDRKGVYKMARAGQLKGVVGVDEEYEVPNRADLTVDVTKQSIPEIVHGRCR